MMKYKIFSLGCKVNSYECAAVSALLNKNGYILDKDNPDVVIINTCSVTHVADQKSRQHVRKFKKDYPNAIILVMGCYAQGNKYYLLNECDADIVIGTSNRNKIVDLINEYKTNKTKIDRVDNNSRIFKYEELGVTSCGENIRCYLKIQDGCNNFCSYCIVPYRRGVSRSRKIEDVITEAKELIKNGYKEIVLSGVHIGMFGKDTGESLESLLKALINLRNCPRIRISSIEESEISEELINIIENNNVIASHLHVPLQSGSNRILKLMGRKYTREEFISKMKYIKSLMPDIALTTDVIVGFPTEIEEDFLDTFNLIKEVGFKELHVFPYSIRSGTLAASIKEQIDPKIKEDRSKRLLNLGKQLDEEYCSKYINKELDVLIEEFDGEFNKGHTSNYIEVKIKDNEPKIGQYLTTVYKR